MLAATALVMSGASATAFNDPGSALFGQWGTAQAPFSRSARRPIRNKRVELRRQREKMAAASRKRNRRK
jgi:hypothetical protein